MIRRRPGLPAAAALTLALVLAAAVELSAPPPARAQSNLQIQASRQTYARALKAKAAGDLAGYRRGVDSALVVRPYHQDLVYKAAGAAALNGDSTAAFRLLRRAAATGLSYPAAEDPDFVSLQGDSTFARLRALFAHNAEPIVRSQLAFRLDEPGFAPEGLAYDAGAGRFFVSSVARRIVVQRSQDGKIRRLSTPPGDSLWSAMGMVVDVAHDRLWVGSAAVADAPGTDSAAVGRAGLFGFDLKTGALARSYRVNALDGPHVFGDITVSSDGDVYLSDAASGAIYRRTHTGDSLEVFITPGVLASPQGLAFSADGRRLYIADYSRGIMIVNMASSQVARAVAPDNTALLGLDGLTRHGNSLIAVQNGTAPSRILRLQLDDSGNRITAVETLEAAHPLMDEPTGGVVVGDDYYYVANGQWGKMAAGKLAPGDSLSAPVVLKMALGGRD